VTLFFQDHSNIKILLELRYSSDHNKNKNEEGNQIKYNKHLRKYYVKEDHITYIILPNI